MYLNWYGESLSFFILIYIIKKVLALAIGSFIIAISIIFLIVYRQILKEKILLKVKIRILNNDNIDLSRYVRVNKIKVLPFELSSLIRYYNIKPQEINDLIYSIDNVQAAMEENKICLTVLMLIWYSNKLNK